MCFYRTDLILKINDFLTDSFIGASYITYDKFRCEIISVKRCPTENYTENYQWPDFNSYSVNCWNFTEIYTTENIIAEINCTEINGK